VKNGRRGKRGGRRYEGRKRKRLEGRKRWDISLEISTNMGMGTSGWRRTTLLRIHANSPRSLLNDPNTSSPANVEASNLYKDNRREYTKRVRETVEKSWED
jgi:ubiquitin-protein ligase